MEMSRLMAVVAWGQWGVTGFPFGAMKMFWGLEVVLVHHDVCALNATELCAFNWLKR